MSRIILNVKRIDDEPVPFLPGKLELNFGTPYEKTIGEEGKEQTNVKMVRVESIATEKTENGEIRQFAVNELPAEVLNAITGFDIETQQLKYNKTALNSILKEFKYEIK